MYGIHRTIISATFIRIETPALFLIGIVSILFFLIILYNRYTVLLSVLFVLIFSAGIFFTYEDVQTQYPEFYEMFLMVSGQLPYRPHLGRMVVWIISMLLAFAVVVFMLHQFNFYMLFLGGAAVFIFTWLPGFSRDERAFLICLVALCLILIRKTNKSIAATFAALPLCVAVIFLTNTYMPQESDFFVPRDFRQAESRRFSGSIRDFFYELFNPVHFSFQTTGFSSAGGRLGGAITPNNRFVMTVYAPGRTYLAGAISNTYTGERWLPTLAEGDINTHGLSPSRFEMLETTAALIRGATHEDARHIIHQLGIPPDDALLINTPHFRALGVSGARNIERPYYNGIMPGTDIMITVWPWEDSLYPGSGYHAGVIYNYLSPWPTEDYETLEERARNLIEQALEDGTFLDYFEQQETQIFRPPHTSYWHTYMPFETLTIRQGTNRMGTIFTPPRSFNLQFAEDSFDYAPFVEITAMGTKQTPSFMSHGAGYNMDFLNVDTRLSFIKNILRGTNAGAYKEHSASDVFEIPKIEGWERGSISMTLLIMEENNVPLPHSPLDVEGLAAIIEFYTHPLNSDVPGGRTQLNYIRNSVHFMRLLNSFSRTVLTEYAREVREHFLEVSASERVHELTLDIVADYKNDFDRVMAIRDYLLQFPYTMNTVSVPRGACFVDFFLFETQEGYCTYFASAMAVMARIAGVPSRYVEGFVLPPSAEPGEPVMVTNRMAHAWVEVYLEGFGWHIMEATPTYAFLMNPDTPLPHENTFTGLDPATRARMQGLLNDFEIPEINRPNFARPQVETPAEEPEEIEEAPRNFILAFFALLGVAMFSVTRLCQIKYKKRRVEKFSPDKKLIAYFNAITEIVAYYKTSPTPYETPKTYGKRYGKHFSFRSDSVYYQDLISLYYKAKYAQSEVTQAEIELMQEAYRDMIQLLRSTHNIYMYTYLRYVRRIGEV